MEEEGPELPSDVIAQAGRDPISPESVPHAIYQGLFKSRGDSVLAFTNLSKPHKADTEKRDFLCPQNVLGNCHHFTQAPALST